jgi:hypothetical protein
MVIKMGKLKLAYVYVAEGADPKKHRSIAPSPPSLEVTTLGVSNYSQAVEECKELVKQGVEMIELCPGFGHVGVGMVADAIGDKAVIGVVRVDRLPVLDCKSGDKFFK